jgi:hypothetical protein
MADTTQLVMAGKRMAMPRFFKRLLQVALAVALTAAILFLMIAGSRFLTGGPQGTTLLAGYQAWLAFVRRPDILTTMVLTAFVSVLLVYWQRDNERKVGGGRPGL